MVARVLNFIARKGRDLGFGRDPMGMRELGRAYAFLLGGSMPGCMTVRNPT